MSIGSNLRRLAIAAGVCMALPAAASAATLVTADDDNNGQNGIMFDVVVGASGVTFQSLEVDLDSSTNTYEFYTIDGGIGGNQSNAAAWTLRDTFTAYSASSGFNTFDITDFFTAANSTIGIYITSTGGFDVNYTNGTGVGNVRATDGSVTILEGYGKSYPFDSTFQPRGFVGSITYAQTGAVPEPGTWLMMLLGFGTMGLALRNRRRSGFAWG